MNGSASVWTGYWGTPLRNPIAGAGTGAVGIDLATREKNYNATDGLYAQQVQWLRSITEWRASDRLQWSNTFYAYSCATTATWRTTASLQTTAPSSAPAPCCSATTSTWWATAWKDATGASWPATAATGPSASMPA